MLYIVWYAGTGEPAKTGHNVWPTILTSLSKS